MKIIELDQNTHEWEQFRYLKIGASQCAAVLGKSKYKNQIQVWEEILGQRKTFCTDAMRRGSMLERIARQEICDFLGTEFKPMVVQSDTFEWQIASLDGYSSETQEIIEIKCPNQSRIQEVEKGNIGDDWMWQIQHQMAVTGANQVNLCIYSENYLEIYPIERNQEMVDELNEKENFFMEKYVDTLTRPEDPLESKNQFDIQCRELHEIKQQISSLKQEAEKISKQLIFDCDNTSFQTYDYTFKKICMKGSVDYSKIPQLDGVDLEPFRTKDSSRWVLHKKKDF